MRKEQFGSPCPCFVRLKGAVVVLCLLVFFALPGICPVVSADEGKVDTLQPGTTTPSETAGPLQTGVPALGKEGTVKVTKHLLVGAKVKRLLNSHTSYEFGNPDPPNQRLSRLEFPLDSWWGGLTTRMIFPRFSIGAEALTNAFGDTDGRMKDSDWEDTNNTSRLTTYSESRNRMETSYMTQLDADMEVSDWLRLPSWVSLRPVLGLRYQYFRSVAHNGTQYDLWTGTPPIRLPGNSIRFKQTYWQYFLGIRTDVDLGRFVPVSDLRVSTQLSWAYAEGANEDTHLLRDNGRRFTYEDTYGHAFNVSVGVRKGLTKNLALLAEFDYLRIKTAGSHRWLVRSAGVDMSWGDGVKVWSEQTGLSLTLQYTF